MASNIHRVWQNYVWRIQTATPQLTRGTLRGAFVHLNGATPGQSAGTSRGFEVRQLHSEKPDGCSNQYSRVADHPFDVDVFYAGEFKPEALGEILGQEAHTLITALELPANWAGYDATHTTDDIGLMGRWATYEVVKIGSLTVLRLHSRAKVKEIK